MIKTAKELLQRAGLPLEGNEPLLKAIDQLLGDTMAELSVKTAMQVITWKQRIEQYESQKQSIFEELIAYKNADEKQRETFLHSL